MNFIEAAILILLIAVLSVPLSNRLHIPLEVFLFVGSCLLSFLPGLPHFALNPTIVFEVFLPPILFSAAYFTSWREFKFNARPITQLAIGLVIFSTVVVAIVAKAILPGFSWPEAFLLGAIISPTDASAATAIIKKLNVPHRLIVLLEGESLINDATALTLYKLSLGVILYGAFSITHATVQFFFVTCGGALIGWLIARLSLFIIRRINYVEAETVFTFLTAFAAYLTAEQLQVSGIISTVVAGIYFGLHFPEFASSQTKINGRASWNTLLFIINGFVFMLIGLQMPEVIKNLGNYSTQNLILYGTLISGVVIATRLLWIYPSAYLPRRFFPSIRTKDPMPSSKWLFTIGWCGMRGIVSLAAVLAIPYQTLLSIPAQHLYILIFLTYVVVGATLILPALTLPILVKLFKLSQENEEKEYMREEATARVRALEAVVATINAEVKNGEISQQLAHAFIAQTERRRQVIHTQLEDNPYSLLLTDYMDFKKLTLTAITAERKTLNTLRKSGEVRDEIFWRLTEELDIEELRAKSLRI